MRLTEAEYRALVVHSPVLIWRAGLDAKCDYFNETWLAYTGRTLEEECGDGWAAGVHPDDFQACVDYYLAHFERREAFEMEYRLRRHDGVYRWILDRGAPFFDDHGVFAGFIGSCIDVDERRRAQEDREQRVLAVAEEFETWVLGIVSHDIRNPLSAISTATQLLTSNAGDPSAVVRNAERIARGVQRIKRLVDDLLDMTRERRGGIPIAMQPADLQAVTRTVIDEITLASADRPIELACAGNVSGTWDPHRIAQAISNLVGNAAQHSAPGTPIKVALSSDGDHAVVEVHNQGEIPAHRLPTLFEPFQAAKPGVSRSGGLGLGLFIANAIARAHGGQLRVETSPTAGTTFQLRIPRGLTA